MAFELQFSVQGSEPEPYRVRIGTEEGRVVAECTCRYGQTYEGRRSLCKHRRAVLEANPKVVKVPATEFNCCCSLKTDHLCSLKIDQGWTPRGGPSAGVEFTDSWSAQMTQNGSASSSALR